MPGEHICPTCSSVLGPSREVHLRRCNACNRQNPHQFNYCGFCASPLENTQMKAKLAELAAPPGGWPSLTAELVQLRFFLEQGQLEDAFELLSILQKRHPGHPALTAFARRAEPSKTDIEVGQLVDSLLASSPDLASKVVRRAAPKWEAPQVVGANRTSVHEVVAVEPPSARPAREPTSVYRAVRPNELPRFSARSGRTIAVDALQPAAPFVGAEDEAIPPLQSAPVEERVNVRAPAAGEIHAEAEAASVPVKKPRGRKKRSPRSRRGGSAFGQHVLTRLGG